MSKNLFCNFFPQRLSLDKEKVGGGINDRSGTVTLSTGLGDNVNLNFMADLSDDDEGHEVGLSMHTTGKIH